MCRVCPSPLPWSVCAASHACCGRDGGDEVRIDDAALHQVDRGAVEVVLQPGGVVEVVRSAQPGGPQHVLAGHALVAEVVDGVAHPRVGHPGVLVHLVEQHRHQPGLPVVAMDDVGSPAGLVHELQGGLAEEGEPGGVVGVAVEVPAVEEVVRRVRVDEVAAPAVHEPEPHRGVHRPAVPGHPQIGVGDAQVEDLVVAQAVVLGQDDLDRMAAPFQLPAQPEHHLRQPAGLGDRGTFGGHHHHIHGHPARGQLSVEESVMGG